MFNLDKYLKELELLTNIDGGTFCIEGVTQVADFFVQKFKEQNWHVELIHHDDKVASSVFATNCDPEGEFDILLCGHMDTVFPEGTVDQWRYEQTGNLITGPGVYDMRASLLSSAEAVFALDNDPSLPRPRIAFVANSNEEISSLYSGEWLTELGKRTKYALVTEPARADGSLVHTRRGLGRFTVAFEGIAAHSGINPEDGRSAIQEMALWIPQIHALTDRENGTNVNVGLSSGGISPNTVAPGANITVDLRFTKNSEYKRIMAAVNLLAENPFDSDIKTVINTIGYRPPMNSTNETMELVSKIEAIARKKQIEGVAFKATGGGSDANFFAHVGAITLDGFGPVGGKSHTRDEYIEADTILPRYELLLETLKLISVDLH